MLLSMAVAIGNLFDDFQNFIDSHFFVPPNLLIAIGIILLVIALFGCVGALKESTAMINIVSRLQRWRNTVHISHAHFSSHSMVHCC